MVNGINSYSGYSGYLQPQGMQQPRGPAAMFSEIDADDSGGISQEELETLAASLSEKTGQSLGTEDALTTFDADESGELSGEELRAFLDASGLQPPPRQGMGRMGPPPDDMFGDADSDASGGISQTELEDLATSIAEETGTTIDTDEAISVYDTNGDGELSGEELRKMMEASGGPSLPGMMQQAMSAYSQNSGYNPAATLMDILSSGEAAYNPVEFIA